MANIFPDYIPEPIGLTMLGKPYNFNDAKMGVFLLKCDKDKLAGLLKTYINTPSNEVVDYKPIIVDDKAYAIMIMASMSVDSRNTEGEEYGELPYKTTLFCEHKLISNSESILQGDW
jgi:hypothetical protein